MLFHDHRVRNGQPLAGPFADGFGREKRVKDLASNVRRNAASRIGHANYGILGFRAGVDRDRALRAAILTASSQRRLQTVRYSS